MVRLVARAARSGAGVGVGRHDDGRCARKVDRVVRTVQSSVSAARDLFDRVDVVLQVLNVLFRKQVVLHRRRGKAQVVLDTAHFALLGRLKRIVGHFVAEGLGKCQFGLFLLRSGVLKPDLHDALLQADFATEGLALGHRRSFVFGKNGLHHFKLDSGHLSAKTLVRSTTVAVAVIVVVVDVG